MKTLPAILRKATPAACLLGLALILTGCESDDQVQQEPLITYAHGTTYGQSAVALPQDLRQDVRHHQRTPHTIQLRHAAPPQEGFTGGN
jgi:hypothetical protein